jgi:hypothetical protein
MIGLKRLLKRKRINKRDMKDSVPRRMKESVLRRMLLIASRTNSLKSITEIVPNVGDVVDITILREIVMQNLQMEETHWKVQRWKMKTKGNEWKKIRRMLKR